MLVSRDQRIADNGGISPKKTTACLLGVTEAWRSPKPQAGVRLPEDSLWYMHQPLV